MLRESLQSQGMTSSPEALDALTERAEFFMAHRFQGKELTDTGCSLRIRLL